MPRPPSDNESQFSLRVPQEWLDEAADIAKRVSPPGVTVTRAQILRAAAQEGLKRVGAKRR